MNKLHIVSAWAEIRTSNVSIPDEILDFMKDSAIEKIEMNGKKLTINKKVLTEMYLTKIEDIAYDLPDKSVFTPEEVVAIVIGLIEEFPKLITYEREASEETD